MFVLCFSLVTISSGKNSPELNARHTILDLLVGLGDDVNLAVQEDWLHDAVPLVRVDPERDNPSWPQ